VPWQPGDMQVNDVERADELDLTLRLWSASSYDPRTFLSDPATYLCGLSVLLCFINL
jgi:hypothetical protein